uniref:Ig-like domain-containing protein n=1 Tax=Scophthalmus maximus TaxID=52904 RepID=A0A8D3BMD1_SCOMX
MIVLLLCACLLPPAAGECVCDSWFISALLLFCPSSCSGEQEETVKPGDMVTLQSRCPGDAVVTLLEWVRLDQKSDGYVFFYRGDRPYANYQHPSFRGRVALRDPEMAGGDVSVTVRNVSVADAGTYTCRVISRTTEHDEQISTEFRDAVRLTVTDAEIWSNQVSGESTSSTSPQFPKCLETLLSHLLQQRTMREERRNRPTMHCGSDIYH